MEPVASSLLFHLPGFLFALNPTGKGNSRVELRYITEATECDSRKEPYNCTYPLKFFRLTWLPSSSRNSVMPAL